MLHITDQWKKAPIRAEKWIEIDFPPANLSVLPKSPGVYVFFLHPDLFGLARPSALMYVGKATSLRSRISAYLGEIDSRFVDTKRPYVWRMLNVWHGYLKYLYTTTPTVSDAEVLENEMLEALIPPANREIPGEIGKKVRAF